MIFVISIMYFLSKINQKSILNELKKVIQDGRPQFCCNFQENQAQDAPETPPGRPKTDFASVLGADLEPCWPPFSAQDGPRGLQDAPGTRYAPIFLSS